MAGKKPRKKIKLKLFGRVKFEPKSVESAALTLVCAGVFGTTFFAGTQVMDGYDNKAPQIFHGASVLAAGSQKKESAADAEENILPIPEGKKISETMSDAADSVKEYANRVTRARKLARQRAANIARIRSGPVPTGPTTGLPDGRRVCAVRNDHPQSGGSVHMDEDCCPDYDEYPNPRCYYTPGQMGILKRR